MYMSLDITGLDRCFLAAVIHLKLVKCFVSISEQNKIIAITRKKRKNVG